MSVIAGMVDRIVPGRPANGTRAMLRSLGRYYPDDIQTVDRGVCALGISYLPTSATGKKSNGLADDGKVCAVVDGRLDHTRELRALLGLDASASDPEIVVAAYGLFGTECFSRLRGDFAIIVWDGRSETVVAARDSFAIRPLCFAASAQWLAVASDPEQILASGLASHAPDDDMVIDYLLRDTRFCDRTFFRDIKALPAGHLLVGRANGWRVSKFRAPLQFGGQPASSDDYWVEYRHRFAAAVEACIESRSPIVAELSGGLDSSLIVCASDRLLSEKPSLCPFFVAAAGLYPGLACDEEPFIEAVANQVHVPVEYWNGTEGTANELDPSSVSLPGGRFATFAGTEGQITIARAHGARVLVSGIGGDQIGTASGGLRDAVTELRWRRAVGMLLGRPGTGPKMIAKTIGALARSFVPARVRRAKAAIRAFETRPRWLSRWARAFPRPRPELDPPPGIQSEMHRRRWRSLTSGQHATLMAYTQHHAIRSGIDIRFPFLDVDLVSAAFAIPPRLWPAAWPFERLHREILKDVLPPTIARRRGKANFEPAVILRVRRHLPFIRDLFSGATWRSGKYVDQLAAGQLLAKFQETETPDFTVTYGLWAVATLEAWLRAILEYPTQTGATMGDHTSEKIMATGEAVLAYERPVLTPVGNLNDVVAGTTQSLLCDAGIEGTDGDRAAGC